VGRIIEPFTPDFTGGTTMASFHQVHYRWAKQIAEDETHGQCTVRVLHDERGIEAPRSVSLWLRDRSSGRVLRVPLTGAYGELADDPAREERLRDLLHAARRGEGHVSN
jgi:hypothetical protein